MERWKQRWIEKQVRIPEEIDAVINLMFKTSDPELLKKLKNQYMRLIVQETLTDLNNRCIYHSFTFENGKIKAQMKPWYKK